MSEEVTIKVPKALVEQFLLLAEQCSDDMSNAGSNDWTMKDTPENRELVKQIEDHYTGGEYEEVTIHKGKILTCDQWLFDTFVEKVKEALNE